MEKLNYKIEDAIIAELLGQQNYTTDESAVLEIVKNAYDAAAKNLKIVFEKDSIRFVDDGQGMNYNDIVEHWMYIGKSSRDYLVKDSNGEERVTAGAKGLGRFALARLGEKVVLFSCKEKGEGIKWETDWNTSAIERNNICSIGTNIVVSGLRCEWKTQKIKDLVIYLSKVFCDSAKMNIVICYGDISESIKSISYEPNYGINCRSSITLQFKSKAHSLHVEIKSNEFDEEAKKYLGEDEKYLYCFEKDINLDAELSCDFADDYTKHLEKLGDFNAFFLFNLKATSKKAKEKFLYRYEQVNEPVFWGISLYRNAFSISGLDGGKDWLELDKRARRSPAAATHPTGAWRVNSSQMSGAINIDKIRNKYLIDLSNRQGIVENEYYKLFVSIVLAGISVFERYRQNIIRKVDKKNHSKTQESEVIVDNFLKDYRVFDKLSVYEKKELVEELQSYKNETDNEKAKVHYESQLLNMLATIGLKASSIAHEMKNDRNNLNVWHDYMIDALKKYGVWDQLSAKENRSVAHRDVPGLIDGVHHIVKKVVVFMNSMLENIQKKRFKRENKNLKLMLENICGNWQRDYGRIKINLVVSENIETMVSEDSFIVIFDNLILNSIQQNPNESNLKIIIKIEKQGKEILFHYDDNGRGLVDKYINEPRRILEPNETSRVDGHGLGMWMVYNTILRNSGDVLNIDGRNGFSFNFIIK